MGIGGDEVRNMAKRLARALKRYLSASVTCRALQVTNVRARAKAAYGVNLQNLVEAPALQTAGFRPVDLNVQQSVLLLQFQPSKARFAQSQAKYTAWESTVSKTKLSEFFGSR